MAGDDREPHHRPHDDRADEPGSADGHGHAHGHSHGVNLARAGARHLRPLALAFAITASLFVVEAVAGFWTNSLALLSDAGHMLTDVVGLGMALAAIQLANRFETTDPGRRNDANGSGTRSSHTFGLYRLEILAAFVNAILLFAVAIWVVIEAIRRLGDSPEVLDGPMLVVAVIGLAANLAALALLHEGSSASLNVRGAYLEVLADLIGSVGVIVGALLLRFFGWGWVDPVFGAAIGVWILPRTWHLGRSAVRVLLQAAPDHIALDDLHADLSEITGVTDVHDLHVWTLTSEMEAASAHLVTAAGTDTHSVLDQARELVQASYGIEHATFQVEPDTHEGCHAVTW